VVISGDLDLLRANDLRQAIAAVESDAVELDLSGAVFVGAEGLRVLLDARLDHRSLRVTAVSPGVWATLESSGTAEYLTGSRAGVVDHPSRWSEVQPGI